MTSVKGTTFRKQLTIDEYGVEITKVKGQPSVTVKVDLVPEPTNPYDKNAIKVEYNGHHIGYVAKEDTYRLKRKKETTMRVIDYSAIGYNSKYELV